MTAQTLPDDLDYCFCPAYGPAGEPQQIRIVVDGLSGYIPTALLALSLRDARAHLRPAERAPRILARGMDRARRTLHERRGA